MNFNSLSTEKSSFLSIKFCIVILLFFAAVMLHIVLVSWGKGIPLVFLVLCTRCCICVVGGGVVNSVPKSDVEPAQIVNIFQVIVKLCSSVNTDTVMELLQEGAVDEDQTPTVLKNEQGVLHIRCVCPILCLMFYIKRCNNINVSIHNNFLKGNKDVLYLRKSTLAHVNIEGFYILLKHNLSLSSEICL